MAGCNTHIDTMTKMVLHISTYITSSIRQQVWLIGITNYLSYKKN